MRHNIFGCMMVVSYALSAGSAHTEERTPKTITLEASCTLGSTLPAPAPLVFIFDSKALPDAIYHEPNILIGGWEYIQSITQHQSPQYAIASLDTLIGANPDFAHNDALLFDISNTLVAQGHTRQSTYTYTRLIHHYPNSPYTPKARMQLGQVYLDQFEPDKALTTYQALLSDPQNIWFNLALYRTGVAFVRLDRYEDAAETFASILHNTQQRSKPLSLAHEATDYLAWLFTERDWNWDFEDNDPTIRQHTTRFLSEVRAKRAVLERLRHLLHTMWRHEEAIEVHRLLMELSETHLGNPLHHASLHQTLRTVKRFNEAEHEAKQFAALYGRGSRWQQSRSSRWLLHALNTLHDTNPFIE